MQACDLLQKDKPVIFIVNLAWLIQHGIVFFIQTIEKNVNKNNFTVHLVTVTEVTFKRRKETLTRLEKEIGSYLWYPEFVECVYIDNVGNHENV